MSETLEPALVFRCSQNRCLKEQLKFRGPRRSQPGLLACALWGQPTAKKCQACQSTPTTTFHALGPTGTDGTRRIGEIKHRQLPQAFVILQVPLAPKSIQHQLMNWDDMEKQFLKTTLYRSVLFAPVAM